MLTINSKIKEFMENPEAQKLVRKYIPFFDPSLIFIKQCAFKPLKTFIPPAFRAMVNADLMAADLEYK